MKTPNYAAIAAALAIISEQFTVIEGSFRAAAGGGESAGGDDEAGEPVPAKRSRKPASAAASKPAKPVKGGEAEAPEVTEDSLRAALKELSATKGKTAVTKALAAVGAGRLPDVDEDDYPALDAAIKDLMDADDDAEDDAEDTKPAAKTKAKPAAKGKAKPAPVPTLEELTESFKALIDADKPAAKKVLKDAGLAKLSEIDTDDDDAMREMAAAIAAAMPEDEDDDMV